MPPVAPRGFLEAPESAHLRLQLSAWCSLSRFAAGSLPTPPGFQAAALRFNNTKSFYTTNEIYYAIVYLSTPDEARQTINNSNRDSMNYTLSPSQYAAPSHKHQCPRLCTTSCHLVLPPTIIILEIFEHITSTCKYLWSSTLKLKLSDIFVLTSNSTPSLLRRFEHSPVYHHT